MSTGEIIYLLGLIGVLLVVLLIFGKDIKGYFRQNKVLWLAPSIAVVMLLGGLAVYAEMTK